MAELLQGWPLRSEGQCDIVVALLLRNTMFGESSADVAVRCSHSCYVVGVSKAASVREKHSMHRSIVCRSAGRGVNVLRLDHKARS